jgi:hypothetical protein
MDQVRSMSNTKPRIVPEESRELGMEESTTISAEHWRDISKRLQESFDPQDVDFRVQGKVNEPTGRAPAVAYVDARVVQNRLDDVVGAGNWSFDWTPVVVDQGEVMIAKGTLTIHGVSKSDAGTASNFEQSLGAVSHCFKRAAVHWGIGRYLYNLPMNWVTADKGGRIPDQVVRELRDKLPRPDVQPTAQSKDADKRTNKRLDTESLPEPVRQVFETKPQTNMQSEPSATEQQLVSIRKLCVALGRPEPDSTLTFAQARQAIAQLSGEYQRARRAS